MLVVEAYKKTARDGYAGMPGFFFRGRLIILALTGAVLFIFAVFECLFFSSAHAVPTHLDKGKLPKGCSECHKGHGKKKTPLLNSEKEDFCFSCHSMAGGAANIYAEITKTSSHPVVTTGRYHEPGEEIPEKNLRMQRHASCYDCHNAHKSERGKTIKGMRGYSGLGSYVREVRSEYELCYRCHSLSTSLPSGRRNVADEFTPSNPSYHPVESYSKASFVPSLDPKFRSGKLIICSDCHGNDNPSGPQGPHGSNHKPLLKHRYTRDAGPESPNTYALCYACHSRASIINDESFKAHKKHIVYGQVSCAQCHDAHGSKQYRSLLNFDPKGVFPNSAFQYQVLDRTQGMPRCLLKCHVNGKSFDHVINEKLLYCVNQICLPE